MSQLSTALEWIARVKKILNLGDLSDKAKELESLRASALEITSSSEAAESLAPELLRAIADLANRLTSDSLAEQDPTDQEIASGMVRDFRAQFVGLTSTLEPLLTEAETNSFKLALELTDQNCQLDNYEGAMKLLQQAWHRAKAIEAEGREPEVVEESSPEDDLTEEEKELAKKQIKTVSLEISKLTETLEPLSPRLVFQTGVFTSLLHQLLTGGKYSTAHALLQTWYASLEEAIELKRVMEENRLRNEEARKLREEEAQRKQSELEKLTAHPNIERAKLQQKVGTARDELMQLFTSFLSCPGYESSQEKTFLEPIFSVERFYTGLVGGEEVKGEAAREFNAVLAKAEKAFENLNEYIKQQKLNLSNLQIALARQADDILLLKENVRTARDSLENLRSFYVSYPSFDSNAEAALFAPVFAIEKLYPELVGDVSKGQTPMRFEVAFNTASSLLLELNKHVEKKKSELEKLQNETPGELNNERKKLESLRQKNDEAIALQLEQIAEAEIAYTEYRDEKYRTVVGKLKADNQVFHESSRRYYKDNSENPESSIRKEAKEILTWYVEYDRLVKDLNDQKEKHKELEQTKKDSERDFLLNLEKKKRIQTTTWPSPAPIVYGTPLTSLQLCATLSCEDGDVEYYWGANRIESGKTLLPAGTHVLKAVVVEQDTDNFQITPPKEVTLNVTKAKVTVACEKSLEVTFGTPFKRSNLNVNVTTEPSVVNDHAYIIQKLTCNLNASNIVDGKVLDVGDYTLEVFSGDLPNYTPSIPITVAVKVKAATVEVEWTPAISAFTYGDALTLSQLNAQVTSADPNVKNYLADLTKSLQYYFGSDEVNTKTVLNAGDDQELTVKMPDNKNFLTPEPKTAKIKVELQPRKIFAGKLEPIGVYVMAADMKQISKKVRLNGTPGTLEYSIADVKVVQGAQLTAGTGQKLRAEAARLSNYTDVEAAEVEVDVLSFAESRETSKKRYDAMMLKDLHSKQRAELKSMQEKIDELAIDDSPSSFEKIDGLLAEMEKISAMLGRWQSAFVPAPTPKGTIKFEGADTSEKIANTIKDLVTYKGLTLETIEQIVPKGTTSSFRSSENYPNGFKYTFTINGLAVEVYGHGATINDEVDDNSDSKKGNLVRIKIGTEYVKPDGSRTQSARDADSHMPLY